jgi:methionyl-tRNA formyltransferase
MRIIFIGSTRRGYAVLETLLTPGAPVVGVISLKQHDHEIERYELQFRELSERHHIPLYETRLMKERDYAALIRDELQPTVAFVVGCRILIPEAIYRIPQHGMLAVHDSFLPDYRGLRELIAWRIAEGLSLQLANSIV